jgi:aspartate/methionine/tyrosine aminotransferase
MGAIEIAITATAGAGEEVVLLTPAWPNFAGAAGIGGATPVEVPLDFDGTKWSLNIDRLSAAVTPATRAIFINSPSNPTGWTASEDDLRAILAVSRKAGAWIIADEVYSRFVFDSAARAPSFYDVMNDDDLILFVNTFSKNWAMTGWRIGWLAAPESIGNVIENLIQYSTSGVATFMQRGAIAALEDGEWFVREQIERSRAGREIVCGGLQGSNRINFAWPDGAFYLFFRIEGIDDTASLGLRLVDEANLGMAPGTAFGEGGAPFMRLCFLRKADDLKEATRRLSAWLDK